MKYNKPLIVAGSVFATSIVATAVIFSGLHSGAETVKPRAFTDTPTSQQTPAISSNANPIISVTADEPIAAPAQTTPATSDPTAPTSTGVTPASAPATPARTVIAENHINKPNPDGINNDFYCSYGLSDGTTSPEVYVGKIPIDTSKVKITLDCPAYTP